MPDSKPGPKPTAAKPQPKLVEANLLEAVEALTARVDDIESELKGQIEAEAFTAETSPQFIGLTDVSGTRRVVGLAHIAHVTPVHDQEGLCDVKLSLAGVPPLRVRADINEIHSALAK